MIRVQQEDFDIGAEIAALRADRTDIGAIVTFTGTVRDTAGGEPISEMTLEHYPGMTEKELERIEREANARWPLQGTLIVHRHGPLRPGDNIVLVVTASAHRQAAFEAAEFLMDFLKQGTRGGWFADANPKFKLLTLPFLVADWDQAVRLVTSDFMQQINRGARDRGWHVPATGISLGFRAHTNSVRPITHPDDLQGLRMRVPPQEVFIQTAQAFGANPQEIAAVEIYQALQTGRVDGQDNPPSNIWDYKIYEVSKYMTITNYATGPDPLMVNLEWYQSLPKDLQQTFDDVAREALRMSDQLHREKEQEYIDMLAPKLEINYVRGDDLQPFRDAVRPVYDYFVGRGDFTWDEIEQARQAAEGVAH